MFTAYSESHKEKHFRRHTGKPKWPGNCEILASNRNMQFWMAPEVIKQSGYDHKVRTEKVNADFL